MAKRKRRWTIARARQELPKLIASAAREPQAVYRRDQQVATVVSPELAAELQRRPRLGEALAELRRICDQEGAKEGDKEGYALPVLDRRDRPNPFGARRR